MQIIDTRDTHLADLDAAALSELRRRVTGEVFVPADAGYDAARRPWSLHIVQHPALVVMAANAHDVAAAVGFAHRHGLPVAVQATGHGVVRAADGAVLINTARMQGVTIDPLAGSVRVAAGATWGPVLEAAQDHGFAPLLGSSPTVGVVGYTLGGGMGWLARKYGLASDSVRAIEVVTADGTLRRVTATSDPELFWGLRGSSGNLGVVTELEFTLYPLREVYAGNIFFPIEAAREVMSAYADWAAQLPDEWTSSVLLMHMPPAPFVPEPLRGRSVVIVRGCFVGEPSAGATHLAAIRALGGIIVDTFGPLPFRQAATISNDPIEPMAFHGRTETLHALTPSTIEALIALAGEAPGSPLVFAEVRQMGGALAKRHAGSGAFGQRDTAFVLYMLAMAHDPAQEAAVARYIADSGNVLRDHSSGQIYLNFLQDDDYSPERVRAGYDRDDYQRLRALKQRYDPANMFRFNRNIPPDDE